MKCLSVLIRSVIGITCQFHERVRIEKAKLTLISKLIGYLIFTFSIIRFSYSSCVKMPFSSSNSTRLESMVSKRSVSSAGSRLTLLDV
jgi:hypothetical protein